MLLRLIVAAHLVQHGPLSVENTPIRIVGVCARPSVSSA